MSVARIFTSNCAASGITDKTVSAIEYGSSPLEHPADQILRGDPRRISATRSGSGHGSGPASSNSTLRLGSSDNRVAATLPADSLTNPWRVQQNYFTTTPTGQGALVPNSSNRFFRLVAVDVSTKTPLGYTNFVASYGLLHTVAGNGYGAVDGSNYWHANFEGGYATNAALSRPHFAIADAAGSVFIVDKDSHSVLKVTPDGRPTPTEAVGFWAERRASSGRKLKAVEAH